MAHDARKVCLPLVFLVACGASSLHAAFFGGGELRVETARAATGSALVLQPKALADDTQAFFVATTGSNANAGTMAAPFRDIAVALAAANASGTKKRVLVSQGTYNEAIVVPNNVSLYGGFDAAAGWTRAAANTTTISATSNVSQVYPVTVSGCTGTCYVDGFSIVTGTATGARNAIAIFLNGSPGARISHNTVTAGNGGTGIAGSAPPATPGGNNGIQGGVGCTTCNGFGSGGAGGASSCGANGGAGGNGGNNTASGQNGTAGSGTGSGGGFGSGSVSSGCFGGGVNATGGQSGGSGAPGGPGSGGTSGVATVMGWVTGAGTAGTAGSAGRGGGGGGGGGGGRADVFCGADGGGGGGGGGAGGCGGAGGAAGGGGGASIAVLAVGSNGALVVSNAINRGTGGTGGNGGAGGLAGTPGTGQGGGIGPDDAGNGGSGGNGGPGGPGGGGGGGAGGPSYGILSSSGTLGESNNTFFGGNGGAGGGGGTPSGPTGASGVSTAVSGTSSLGSAAGLSIGKSGPGTVAADIGWIDCGSTCSAIYANGTVVTLSATPGGGQVFAGWGGDCSGTAATCVLTMSAARSVVATFVAAGSVAPGPASLDFGGQSMATTSPAQSVSVTNAGGAAVAISGIGISDAAFVQTNTCGSSLAAGATCAISVTFTPPANGATPLNGTVTHGGTLSITSDASGSPHTVTLAGVGEKSLVTHYYRSILRRAPDTGGVPYWQGEAARVAGLGANVNETWYALAQTFYTSPEYVAFNRTPTAFVTDLYNTFFNRAPDTDGLNYWVGLIGQGMPREVVLVSFEISDEFTNFAKGIFGNTAARAEVDTVIDFYRGLLSRLPDSEGFQYWVGEFRKAQCQGAAAVYAKVEAISSAYQNSPEYAARNRSNAQFVGDVYNAFLRRGGDLGGVQYWIGQLDSGARTRQNVRQTFISTPEFSARVQAIINQGCLQ